MVPGDVQHPRLSWDTSWRCCQQLFWDGGGQLAGSQRVWTSAVLQLLTLLACAGAGPDKVTVWMSWLCCKVLTGIPDCWPELTSTQCWPTPSRFVATPGISYLPFSWPHGQAKCWDMQFCPMEKDRLGQGCAPACCRCELAPSVGEGFPAELRGPAGTAFLCCWPVPEHGQGSSESAGAAAHIAHAASAPP